MTSSSEWTLGARWLFPVDQAPLAQGTLTIRGDRIVAVEPHGCRTPDIDLGNAALLPGFVNAHTHLDLSGLRGRTPPGGDFTAWLRAVIHHRRSQTADQIAQDIQSGLAESIAAGTTLVGDIASQGASWPALSAANLRATVFYELLGLPRTRAHQAWAAACQWLRLHPATPTCRPGLSPHAPYSVRASLFRAAANLAGLHDLPLATHLAETQAEMTLLTQRLGPFVDFLKDVGVWDPKGLINTPEHLIRLFRDVSRCVLVHANYLNPITSISPGATFVYCPRTHAAFGHPRHPFHRMLQDGLRVALGTDSLASNPDLSVLAEARYVCEKLPELADGALLRMVTINGAEALGWEHETGTLTPGKSADLVVLKLADRDAFNPHELLFAPTAAVSVLAVYFRGRHVHQAEDEPGNC